MQGQFIAHGVTQYAGTPEAGGQSYDHTKVIVNLPFPKTRADSAVGSDAVAIPYGTHENFKKFQAELAKGHKFPFQLDCEYEPTTKGFEILEIYNIKPMQIVPLEKK